MWGKKKQKIIKKKNDFNGKKNIINENVEALKKLNRNSFEWKMRWGKKEYVYFMKTTCHIQTSTTKKKSKEKNKILFQFSMSTRKMNWGECYLEMDEEEEQERGGEKRKKNQFLPENKKDRKERKKWIWWDVIQRKEKSIQSHVSHLLQNVNYSETVQTIWKEIHSLIRLFEVLFFPCILCWLFLDARQKLWNVLCN